ncbi:hypothetical protein [Psychrobacillus sp. L3]|uniref:hypothetical protein n=1 Tax=Psychrobacillus sp. L3 TaxID=3236891 RepID=UPI0036F3D9DB
MWNGNIVEIITISLAWLVIGIIAFRLYKKHSEKPELWKVIIVILVGLFSFSFNWNVSDKMINVAVLPLGVWILYGFLNRKKERWKKYRHFAWLGFLANFILLSSTLVAIPVNLFIFPENKPETYISDVENASIINIHPSAKEHQQVKENLLKLIHRLKQKEFFSDDWYNETYMDTESNKRKERFPYMLIHTLPKWGSGQSAIIYIEGDGKGLLIETPKKQFYFHSDQSLLEEGK